MVLVLENRWTSISYDLSFIAAMTDRDWFEYEYCFAEYEYRVAEYDTNRRNQPQTILLAPLAPPQRAMLQNPSTLLPCPDDTIRHNLLRS